jgi:hypothetical protein
MAGFIRMMDTPNPVPERSGDESEKVPEAREQITDWEFQAPEFYRRAFEDISRELRLEGKLDGKEILVLHSMKNVAVAKAFPEANVQFIEPTDNKAANLGHHGFDGEKAEAETLVGKEAKIVVLLDENVTVTWQIQRLVQRDGIFVCLPKAASRALKSGEFFLKGVVPMDSASPEFVKDPGRFGSVETDSELQHAQRQDEFVSYTEALQAVQRVYPGSSMNVVEKYRELLRNAKEGTGGLTYTLEDGTEMELEQLPPKPGSENNWWILKKKDS